MSTDLEPALTSPCPHTPACPPPVCLPPSLRPSTSTVRPGTNTTPVQLTDSGQSDLTGYETAMTYIDKFAGTMSDTADGVGLVRQRTPRFEGWNLVPLAGVPVVGLLFVNRLNTIADTWSDSAGILGDVLTTDAGTVSRSAQNYRQAEN